MCSFFSADMYVFLCVFYKPWSALGRNLEFFLVLWKHYAVGGCLRSWYWSLVWLFGGNGISKLLLIEGIKFEFVKKKLVLMK